LMRSRISKYDYTRIFWECQ